MTEPWETETSAADQSVAPPAPPPSAPLPLDRRHWSPTEWVLAGLLVVAVFTAYRPAWYGGFVWDDREAHITRPDLRSWDGLYKIWFHVHATQQYYPLLYSAFWLEYQIWGERPLFYHLTNILMHALVALMLAEVLRRLQVPGAFFAAAIFALHPVQVESVAWITELKNTLSAAFYLAAMMAYLDFDQSRQRKLYVLALVLFVLSLLAKTVTATLPAALLVIFWWKRGQLSWQRDVRPLLPFFGVAATFGVLVAWWEHSVVGAHGSLFNFSLFQRCLIAGHAVCFYLGKLFCPVGLPFFHSRWDFSLRSPMAWWNAQPDLIFFYPRWDLGLHPWLQCLYPALAIGILVVLWKLRGRWRAPLAAYLFYVGTLFPLLGFSNAVLFKYTFVADHFQYLASMGMIALVAGLIAQAFGWAQSRSHLPDGTEAQRSVPGQEVPPGRRDLLPDGTEAQASLPAEDAPPISPIIPISPILRPAGYLAGVALLAVLATLTWRQSSQYNGHFVLFPETIKRNPGCWLASNYLGNELLKMGRTGDAVKLFQATLQVNPGHSGAHQNLGLVWERKGLLKDAEREYREAIKCEPEAPQAYRSLAMLLARQGRFGDALALCRLAEAKVDPNNVNACAYACYSEGRILQLGGRSEESIPPLKKAVELGAGEYPDAECSLATSLGAVGRTREAADQYRAVIGRYPDYVEARCGLGRLLQATRRYDEAMTQFKAALRIDDKSADAHVCLALALTLRDRWDDALKHYRRAVKLEPNSAEALMGAAMILGQCPDRSLRNGLEAVELARRADDLSGHRRPEVLQVLAGAYNEAGQMDEAVATAKKALDLAIQQKQPQLERMLRQRLREWNR